MLITIAWGQCPDSAVNKYGRIRSDKIHWKYITYSADTEPTFSADLSVINDAPDYVVQAIQECAEGYKICDAKLETTHVSGPIY